jgi:ADP-ribose pyrophosphatase
VHRAEQPTPWLLEIPAGLNDLDDPAAVGIKEVKEETGLTIEQMLPIGSYYTTPGGFSEKIYLFCALVDSEEASGIHGVVDEGEEIKVVVLSFEDVWDLLQNGLVTSSSTYIALQWLALNRVNLRQK